VPTKLTVLIPCKDERLNIRPCIESIRSIADEILIADSGSTDGTLDIVREMGGCRIIEREYVNSANFKNWAIPQARHSWVLLVDADERVTPELAEDIRQVLAAPPAEKDGFWIGRLNHYLGYRIKHCGWNSDDVIRLFRRDESRYEARWVHSEVVLPPERVGKLRHSLLHYTTWDSDQYLRKQIRYANWGAMNLRDRGHRPSTAAMFLRAPLRFLQLYFLRLGFLDGAAGFQVCMHTAFYAFLKQAKLWEMHHALPQPDPEAAADDRTAHEAILPMARGTARAASTEIEKQGQRRAA
jgi:glycosyltransferase involved in cell wall biosynthesis